MPLNQYHVVMEVEPQFWQNPNALRHIYVRGAERRADSAQRRSRTTTGTTPPLAVNHSGQFPSVTISFNLPPGVSLGDAVEAIDEAAARNGAAGDAFTAAFQGRPRPFRPRSATSRC